MILYGLSFFIFIFTSFSLFWKTDYNVVIKIIGILIIFAVSMKYVIYQALGGAFFSPDLPRSFILTMEALYGALILLFIFLIIWDIYLLGNWLLHKIGFPVPNLSKGFIKSSLVALALALGIWGTWESIKVPDVRTVDCKIKDLPQELENFSIIQLSDLHIGPILKKDWLEQVVLKVNAQNPDLIALTGDYIDGYAVNILSEIEPLSELKAKYGIFGVTGNHEYYWNVTEWEDAITKLGVKFLTNNHEVIKVGDQELVIAGIPDVAASRFGFEEPDIEKTFRNAPEKVRILLAHQPKFAKSYLEQADLQLSGHTHGGLMVFLQPLIAHFNDGFVYRQYQLDKGMLYVSPGTGLWNGFSSRIGVPSEIVKIILKKG